MSKQVKKVEVKDVVTVAVEMVKLGFNANLEDFNSADKKSQYVFRGQVLESSQAVEISYNDKEVETVDCRRTISSACVSYKADNIKKYTFKDDSIELNIVELKQGLKSIMYAYKGETLVYGNVSKKVLIYELAHFTNKTFNIINSKLATLAGRKDGYSKANKEVVTLENSFTL